MNFNQYISECELNEYKVSKEQKYDIFDGCSIKNKLYIKKYKNKVALLKVTKWQQSGNAINNIGGEVGLLEVFSKSGENHYYVDVYSLSIQNNFVYKYQYPIKTSDVKKILSELGITDLKKFNELKDHPDAKSMDFTNVEFLVS